MALVERDGTIPVMVLVEIPAGSRNKYEFDEEVGGIVLDRRLFTSMSYPADYGYIEGTLGGDGDPLDALVLAGDPTFPGCRIRARPIGLFRMTDEKGPDEKIICVSARDPFWAKYRQLAELDENLRNEIDHFFRVYKELETKKVDTRGFADRTEAERVIAEARKRAGLSQRDLATRILKEDGAAISPQYLNDLERDRRNPPSPHLIREFARELQLPYDYLSYTAGELPDDLRDGSHPPEQVQAAFKAFRRTLQGGPT